MFFAKILASKLFGPIAAAVAALAVLGLVVQTIRIDGFPFFGPGLRGRLAECENVNTLAAKERDDAIAKSREEGRASAALDAQGLISREVERRAAADKSIEDLRLQVSKLRPVAPPPIILPGQPEPPIVVTPPALPAACQMNQEALDAIRLNINAARRGP